MTDNTQHPKNSIEEELNRRRKATLPQPIDNSLENINTDVAVNFKSTRKKADPWTRVNIKVPILAKYEAYAKKKGITAQQLITQILNGWISDKK